MIKAINRKMRKHLVLLLGLMILFCACVSMYDAPKESPKAAEETFRIVTYENYAALGTLCPQYKSYKQGFLKDADFKKYVMTAIEDTDYVDIRWYYFDRATMGLKYIGYAYVYYWKKK